MVTFKENFRAYLRYDEVLCQHHTKKIMTMIMYEIKQQKCVANYTFQSDKVDIPTLKNRTETE